MVWYTKYHGSAGIEMLFRPVPGRDKAYPGRDRDRYRDENEIPAGTGIRLIPAGTGPVPVFFEYLWLNLTHFISLLVLNILSQCINYYY